MWQPDGGARTRIGVLTPHADVWPEAEFGAMAPDGISIHAARIPFAAYKPGGNYGPDHRRRSRTRLRRPTTG
jgi:maleate isomerase